MEAARVLTPLLLLPLPLPLLLLLPAPPAAAGPASDPVPARAPADVVKDVTLGFGEALQHCREESKLTEDKMEEFFHFWREDFEFDSRELGCAIECMSRHFDLLTDSHRMHRENTAKFIESFPNGAALAAQLVLIVHECERPHEGEPDHCWRILRVAACFQRTSRARGLAPAVELLVAEFIMESEAR